MPWPLKPADRSRPPPEPVAVNAFAVVAVGTAAWFVGFCVLVGLRIAYGAAAEAGHRDWLWTALAGVLLGLLGLYVTRRRR